MPRMWESASRGLMCGRCGHVFAEDEAVLVIELPLLEQRRRRYRCIQCAGEAVDEQAVGLHRDLRSIQSWPRPPRVDPQTTTRSPSDDMTRLKDLEQGIRDALDAKAKAEP